MLYLVYILAGAGAGVVTGLAGLSAAVVITPLLVSVCEWQSYDAVTVALAADVLASLLTAYTYYKNKNIDLKNGMLVAITAFIGTIIGSYCGYLFSQSQPDGLGYISMITTIGLGIKFLIKPIEEGHDAESGLEHISKKKITQAMLFGCGIGWICGFTGSGGGILMLTVFTLHLGYNLKVAVGTSTMIMTLVALTGTVSHISMGATRSTLGSWEASTDDLPCLKVMIDSGTRAVFTTVSTGTTFVRQASSSSCSPLMRWLALLI